MTKDKFHIEMEDISEFAIERSEDFSFWEGFTHEEFDKLLADISEEKLKVFLGVLRNGSSFQLGDYYYRVKAD